MTTLTLTETDGYISVNGNVFAKVTDPAGYSDFLAFDSAVSDFDTYKLDNSRTMNKYSYILPLGENHQVFVHTVRTYDNRAEALADRNNLPQGEGVIEIVDGKFSRSDFGDLEVITFSVRDVSSPFQDRFLADGTYEAVINDETFYHTDSVSLTFYASKDSPNAEVVEIDSDSGFEPFDDGNLYYGSEFLYFASSENFVFAYPHFAKKEINLIAIPKSAIL